MGRRAKLLTLNDAASVERAERILGECSDILDDGYHVTLVEDLRDIAQALAQQHAEILRLRNQAPD